MSAAVFFLLIHSFIGQSFAKNNRPNSGEKGGIADQLNELNLKQLQVQEGESPQSTSFQISVKYEVTCNGVKKQESFDFCYDVELRRLPKGNAMSNDPNNPNKPAIGLDMWIASLEKAQQKIDSSRDRFKCSGAKVTSLESGNWQMLERPHCSSIPNGKQRSPFDKKFSTKQCSKKQFFSEGDVGASPLASPEGSRNGEFNHRSLEKAAEGCKQKLFLQSCYGGCLDEEGVLLNPPEDGVPGGSSVALGKVFMCLDSLETKILSAGKKLSRSNISALCENYILEVHKTTLCPAFRASYYLDKNNSKDVSDSFCNNFAESVAPKLEGFPVEKWAPEKTNEQGSH